jgi:hypothetical protein
MNKFGKPTEEDYQTVSEVIEMMVTQAPGMISARSQAPGKPKESSSNHDDSRVINQQGSTFSGRNEARGGNIIQLGNVFAGGNVHIGKVHLWRSMQDPS